jgi:hypothetical protein
MKWCGSKLRLMLYEMEKHLWSCLGTLGVPRAVSEEGNLDIVILQ